MIQVARKYYTPAEYLALEDAAEFRSEYFKGQIYQMAGGTLNHNRIARNLSNLLTQGLGNGGCEVFIGDVKVLVAENGLYTYPDLLVICGEPEFVEDRNDTVTNPVVIIEVLSGSTRAYDQTDKFDLYKSIETFQHYILVEQDRSYIHYFQKANDNKWTIQTIRGLDKTLVISELGLELSLQQIYERVQFPPIVSTTPQVI